MVESEVAQSCPTLCDPMDCSLRGSSVHGIFQARVLEWVPREATEKPDCGWVSFNPETSLVAQVIKHLPAMQETRVQSLGQEDPLEKGMATHSSILA